MQVPVTVLRLEGLTLIDKGRVQWRLPHLLQRTHKDHPTDRPQSHELHTFPDGEISCSPKAVREAFKNNQQILGISSPQHSL